jgi:hypothetical protein
LPAGVEYAAVKSAGQGDTAKSVKLVLTTSAAVAGGPFQIVGRAAGDRPLVRIATAPIPDAAASTPNLWLTIVPATK